ncbi:MAG: hypothetical protein BGN86_15460 [Caulobacterales bacterium 68-7]|nr:MAG: hypothetical protein BGN86_15460 [Caulobacterales bacterium 68-7]
MFRLADPPGDVGDPQVVPTEDGFVRHQAHQALAQVASLCRDAARGFGGFGQGVSSAVDDG